jgi:hypothetical protein
LALTLRFFCKIKVVYTRDGRPRLLCNQMGACRKTSSKYVLTKSCFNQGPYRDEEEAQRLVLPGVVNGS